MTSVTQIADIVKALPTPWPVKEAVLDQLIGDHSCLSRPNPPRRRRPLAERLTGAREIGAFADPKERTDGATVWTYFKNGVPFYKVAERDGEPLSCTCKDFEFGSLCDMDYCCKHMALLREMLEAPTGAEIDALMEACADAAARFERIWILCQRGIVTAEICNATGRELDAARKAVRMHLRGFDGRTC